MTNLAYESIRDQLNTGDIVLFSGKGPLSAAIKLMTCSKWSHVGMVVKLEQYDFVTLWESTTLSTIPDLDTNTLRKGVQLVPLSDRINSYDGDVAIRQLRDVRLSQSSIQALMKLRKDLRGRPYEKNHLELLKSVYDGYGGENKEDLSSVFCSETVGEGYQALDLVSENKPSNEYTQADFTVKNRLPLLSGWLDYEHMVKQSEK